MSAIPGRTEHIPSLRLVRPTDAAGIDEARARRRVAEENRAASALSGRGDARAEEDVRLIFALRASQALEGGRSAILTPPRRRRLVNEARRFGLRAFEANLIIAIVQDSARRGQAPAGAPARDLIGMIPPGGGRGVRDMPLRRLVAAGLIACGIVACLVRWVLVG